MLKVAKFGGSSMADAGQYQKIRDIIRSDPSRRVVVVSAAGKRSAGDNKITDLLYLCYAHLQYGVSCDGIYQMIRERYGDIHRELGLRVDLEGVLDRLRSQMEQGISRDELVSRGEYLSALLMADYLGFTFVDAAQWLFFHYDGTIDQEKSYAALRALAKNKCVVIPGFYGLMPDGKLRTLTRGGSDITGALAAAALDADVYENWTDVSGILMADPRIVDHPRSIERATYSELRQLSYSGAQVLHEMTIFPVREKNIPLNIRNTNEPGHPGTLITESFVEAPNPERFVTGIAGKCDFPSSPCRKRAFPAPWARCAPFWRSLRTTAFPWRTRRAVLTASHLPCRRRRSRRTSTACSTSCAARSARTASRSTITLPSSPSSAARWPSASARPARSSQRSARPASTSA